MAILLGDDDANAPCVSHARVFNRGELFSGNWVIKLWSSRLRNRNWYFPGPAMRLRQSRNRSKAINILVGGGYWYRGIPLALVFFLLIFMFQTLAINIVKFAVWRGWPYAMAQWVPLFFVRAELPVWDCAFLNWNLFMPQMCTSFYYAFICYCDWNAQQTELAWMCEVCLFFFFFLVIYGGRCTTDRVSHTWNDKYASNSDCVAWDCSCIYTFH